MYSHYMNGNFSPFAANDTHNSQVKSNHAQIQSDQADNSMWELNKMFSGLKNLLPLSQLDFGDILLVLIILLLFLEGDNLETVITLGLMLLFTLND